MQSVIQHNNATGTRLLIVQWTSLFCLVIGLLSFSPNLAAADQTQQEQQLQDTISSLTEKISEKGSKPADIDTLVESKNKLKQIEQAKEDFKKLGFGIAVAATGDLGSNTRIQEAKVVNNIVRVTKDSEYRIQYMLELHKWLLTWGNETRGFGLFAAIAPDTNNILGSAGLGVMMGFRNKEDISNSLNIGLGVTMDQNQKVLGDGITKNEPLPSGETEVRTRDTTRASWMLIASFSFY